MRRGWSVIGALALVLPVVVVAAGPASAANWGISKQELSTGPYAPGDQVQWVVSVSCSDPNADPCVPTTVTDPLPDGLDLVSASIQSAGGATNPAIDPDDDSDTVTFTADSAPNGGQVQLLITAEVDDDLPYSDNGATFTNTATVVSDNADEKSASDDIDIVVPLLISSTTTKSIDPSGAIASPGTPATINLGSTNTSNDPVDTLVIQDPSDVDVDPNPFEYLTYDGTGDITYPPDATDVTEEYYDGTDWLPLDDSVDPTDVQGVRYTFTGDIQPGATASVPVNVVQNDSVTELTDAYTVNDEASSYVTHAGADPDSSTPTTADDTYVITPPNNSVSPSKTFDPDTVSAGASTTVNLSATNEGDPTTSMTITEPSPGTPDSENPFLGDDPITFTGWGGLGDDPATIQWPANADTASVTFTCADGTVTDPPLTTDEENTLADPPDGCVVVGFSVEFTGDIVTGAEAVIPFAASTDPDQAEDDVTHHNEMTADIPNDTATASDDLVTLTDRLATETSKTITPSEIPALPGQSVVVQLPTRLLPFGPDGSTTNADQVIVQDPQNPDAPGDFWDDFTATSVRSTDVPPDSTLTINYLDPDTGEWVAAPGCGPYTGPATADCELPDGAAGVQFVYDSTSDDQFPPGTSFQPNFTAAYDGPTDQDDPLANCAASGPSSDTVPAGDITTLPDTDPAVGCDTVNPDPVPTDPGDLDFIEKNFLAPAGQTDPPYTVRARTQDPITAQLTWSTSGFIGVDSMVVSDIENPETTDIDQSFYDAFNLVNVPAINASVDPLIEYDAITGVELYNGTAWVDAMNDPCSAAAPCDGSLPAVPLTSDEQASTIGVRLTYIESPTRTGDPVTAPQPGEGVARSTLADGRHIDLDFQLRDERRSGGAVLGATNGTHYNRPDDGQVRDTASATASFNGTEFTDDAFDDVTILDEPLNIGITKNWTGGPLSVPPPGTPDDAYPSTHAVITATNNSVKRINTLSIAEPSTVNADGVVEPDTTPGTSPFDAFTLTHIDITAPVGTTATAVTLYTDDGNGPVTYDEAGAEALTPAQLEHVIGVGVEYAGRIEASAAGVLDLTLKLREFDRYAPTTRVDTSYTDVPNSAGAEGTDPGTTDDDTPQAWATDDMELRDASISMVETKSFDPAAITEPGSDAETNPTSILTITGRPTGPSRAVEMTLTDVDGSFWNQYDLVGFDGSTLVTPIDQVQVDAYVGGTYDAATDTFVGGSWTDGVPMSDFALPATVTDPSTVVGLRFTFTRADGEIWENPESPRQPVNLEVQVRDTLRSDPETPVPSDLEQNDPAPGETAPGIATNDVTSTVTGADLVVDPDDPDGDLIPVNSTADASGTIAYEHAENGVQIVKDFDGTVSGGTEAPDAVFPMNIAIKNTGNRPIYDPVFVDDPMPNDADGPQLRRADGVAEVYSYALEGDAPAVPNGDPMPTTAAGTDDQVTVDSSGNITSLQFTFPEGTVLEVGQTYTITVMVQFRVGLTARTVLHNTAGVTADRPWDVCQTGSLDDDDPPDGRLDDETGQCQADADVSPIPSGALSQRKLVKASDDEYPLGFIVDPAQPSPGVGVEDCEPVNDDGFYAYPCTPIIPPGHNETWRILVNNVGNLPLDKVVLYDRLPTPGDGPSYQGSDRGSEFAPLLTKDPPPTVVDAPTGSTTVFYYTTVDDYCLDDIEQPLEEPVCPTDDPTTGWVELTPDTSEATYLSITAIKAVVTMDPGHLFQPGASIGLDGTTTTPPLVPDAGDRAIAWNSAAASAVVVTQGSGEQDLLPTEGTKVGVATATGSLEVRKQVTGDAAAYAPDSFDMTVECTSAPGTWVETDLDPIAITVVPGTPTVVPDLPYGASCTVTEDDTAGQTALIAPTVTIDSEDPDDPTVVTAINRYDFSSIVLNKDVVTDATDQDGNPVPFGPFEATVDCTFRGEPVYAEGYSADNPMVITIEDGESVELDELPVGSECVVTETVDGNATSTTVTVRHGVQQPVVTNGVTASLDLAGDVVGLPRNQVTLTNTFDVGRLDLRKVVDGSGAAAYGSGPFRIAVTCTFDDDGDGPGQPRTVYDSTVVLGGGAPLTAEIPNLPTGAVCGVSETDDAGATGAVVVPDSVTIGDDEPVDVVITNTFDTGAIHVDKDLAGLGALYGPGPFEVRLACTYEGVDLPIPGGATREIDAGGDGVDYTGLPVGSQCTLTETDDFGASSTSMTVDGGTPEDGTSVDVVVPPADDGEPTTVTVDVVNTFATAPLVVRKTVAGDGAAFAPPMPDLPALPTTLAELAAFDFGSIPFDEFPYQVSLACTFDGTTLPIPGGATRMFGPGFPGVYFGLPDGSQCTATETEVAGATSTTVDPNPVTVDEDASFTDPVAVDVTNTYDVGSIEVDKVVDGDAAPFVVAPFQVSLACTFEGQDIDVPGGATRTVTPDDPATYDGLPVGAECVVTETDAAGATASSITTTVDGGDPGQVVVPAADDDPAVVTVTNTFDVGSITVDKVVDGEGADDYGKGPFESHLACTFQGADVAIPGGPDRELTPGTPVTYAGLPIGAECLVTEPTAGGAQTTTISSVGGGDPGAVDVVAGATTITITNTFDIGQVTVKKVVAGAGAVMHLGESFPVTLDCTYDVDGTTTGVTLPGGGDRTLSAVGGWTAVYDSVPQGATCTVTETDPGAAGTVAFSTGLRTTTVDPAEEAATSSSFVVPAAAGAAVTMTVTNTFASETLAQTGFASTGLSVAIIVMLVVGLALVIVVRRRSPGGDRA